MSGIRRECGYPPDHDLMKMLRAHAEVRRSAGAALVLPLHANDEPSDDNAA